MEIKDIAGLSEPLKKLIEVVSQGVGAFSKPYLIRKTAEAKAYEIKVISKSIKENQDDLKQIGFDDSKISVMSLDSHSLQQELSIEDRTQNRLNFKEQKRQKNIEEITQKAANNLESESNVSNEPVDEDWTTRFFDYAEDISNEEMQDLWGRILAGEIKQPNSYSLRTLDILRNLSKEEAQVFMKFANLEIQSSGVSFVLNFDKEKLLEDKYQFKFADRLLLEELGLITANILGFKIGKTDSEPLRSVFIAGNSIIVQDKKDNRPEQQLQVLVFTKIGGQLLKLVDNSPQLDYIQLLASKLNRKNGNIRYGSILDFLPHGKISHTALVDVPMTDEVNKNK